MNKLIAHRGPDGQRIWSSADHSIGLAHRRLSILDLSPAGAQPMSGHDGTHIVHNGEIYNFVELRESLAGTWHFHSRTDTETILAAYDRYGTDCVHHLRGMFAFAIWDERKRRLFCARDRFGIKPFYYAIVDGVLYFASEAKALLPFLASIDTDPDALAQYLTFQYCLGEKTLFKGVRQLPPGHALVVENGAVKIQCYWDIRYEIDTDHSSKYFEERLAELLDDSLRLHLRSDVRVGTYLSGGIDSSLLGLIAARHEEFGGLAFNGRFTEFPGYDESHFARQAAERMNSELHIVDITHEDFRQHIDDIMYHLDFPVAGPGAFPQYIVSKLAAERVKVVLGGQGGDEIFGGYSRYLVAYLEQCIRSAIDGTHRDGTFLVTMESIVPNLGVLREYKPLMQMFWRDGLFGPLDERYFRLINRANDMAEEIEWGALNMRGVLEDYSAIFNSTANVRKEAYFDSMTHFDFKCLLPSLLTVEDRMSMAHGLESRVPFLDHPLVEFVASVPADVKFHGGQLKQLLRTTFADVLPPEILNRRDKMGFPVPLKEWLGGPLREMTIGVFRNLKERHRPYINADSVLANFNDAEQFSRKSWALLSLELWHQAYHDRASEFRGLVAQAQTQAAAAS
jgi:asparagine synthase (glutamine-hydrolysing)